MPVGVLPGLIFLAAAVRIEGSATCPTAARVASFLTPLLPGATVTAADGKSAGAEQTSADRAWLTDEGADVLVVLTRPGEGTVGTRRFPRTFACDGLASAIAVSIAVWTSDVHPDYAAARLTGPSETTDPVRLSARPGAPTPAPSPSQDGQPWRWGAGLALGVGGSIDVPAAAGDLLASGWWRPPLASTALRAELEAQSERDLALQDGHGAWRRFALGLGVEQTLARGADNSGSGWLRGFATVRAALLQLRGDGFAINHRDRVADVGASLGLRAVRAQGDWASWIELATALWPIGQELLVTAEASSSRRLPILEAFARVGWGWGAAQ
ncbi:MAG TPA: hypothetical protein VIU64_00900 [Polyangia bacterium]